MKTASNKQTKKHFVGIWLESAAFKKLRAIAKASDRSLAYTVVKKLALD